MVINQFFEVGGKQPYRNREITKAALLLFGKEPQSSKPNGKKWGKAMSEEKDVRWKQRFQNYEKAFKLLERTLEIAEPSEAETGGIIQFYEMSFELGWKILKDYLTDQGFTVKTPRQAIKQAFQIDLIKDGHVWMNALDDRNMTTHIYDESTAKKVLSAIRDKYFPALKQLYFDIQSEMKA